MKRTEVTRTTTPENDSKGLSASVPDSVAVSAKLERVVVVRFKHQADILAGLEKHVKEQKIKNAVILNGVGSVMATHYHVVSNRSFPSKNTYMENPTQSADIIDVSGFVLNGKIHPHFTMADPDKAFGGHLEPGTKAFTFAIITLGVLPDDVDMGKFDDKNWR
jgi:predicted DNA-binding protein with PD1-like motif